MQYSLVKNANIHISKIRENDSRERDTSDTNYIEINALIEMLCMTDEYHIFITRIIYYTIIISSYYIIYRRGYCNVNKNNIIELVIE